MIPFVKSSSGGGWGSFRFLIQCPTGLFPSSHTDIKSQVNTGLINVIHLDLNANRTFISIIDLVQIKYNISCWNGSCGKGPPQFVLEKSRNSTYFCVMLKNQGQISLLLKFTFVGWDADPLSTHTLTSYILSWQQTCAVCLEEFRTRDELGVCPCSHAFHKKWVLSNWK